MDLQTLNEVFSSSSPTRGEFFGVRDSDHLKPESTVNLHIRPHSETPKYLPLNLKSCELSKEKKFPQN